jgi:DNA-directed RNA polymerase specialized sigma subunit
MWSKRWAGEQWAELLSEMSIYLSKNWIKFSAIPDGEQRIKFLQTWMKNQAKWWNSEFNRNIRVNNLSVDEDIQSDFGRREEQISYDDLIELKSEVVRDDIKDWLIDLNQNWNDLEIDRLVKIRQIYLALPSHQKVLYDLYFSQMMSLRDIGKKLDLPLSAVYNMVLELKKNIKEKC